MSEIKWLRAHNTVNIMQNYRTSALMWGVAPHTTDEDTGDVQEVIRWLGHWDAMWVPVIMPYLFVLWLRSELGIFH